MGNRQNSDKKMRQSFHNLFNYLSKTRSTVQQPLSFLINWESGQNKKKGASARPKTCNRKQFGVARRQVYMLLPPSSTMLCHLSNVPTGREGSIIWLLSSPNGIFMKSHYYLLKSFLLFIPSGGFNTQNNLLINFQVLSTCHIPMWLTATYSFSIKSRIVLLEISQGSIFKADPFKCKSKGKLAWIQLKVFEEYIKHHEKYCKQ